MRRIGFRRLLPVINALVYLLFMYPGFGETIECVQSRAASHTELRAASVNSALQENGSEWKPKTSCYSVPASPYIAYAISFPAYVAGSAIGSALWQILNLHRLHVGVLWGEDVLIACCTFLLVPVVWFCVGLWIDRRVGFLSPPQFRVTPVAKLLRFVSALVSTSALLAYMGLLAYAISTAPGRSNWAPFLCLSFWIVFLSLATISNVLRAKQQEFSTEPA